MAKIPALPKLAGLDTRRVTMITAKNMTPLAIKIDNKKVQFTVEKSRRARDKKIKEGRANVPTNVAIPLDSVVVTTLRRPAMYLQESKL